MTPGKGHVAGTASSALERAGIWSRISFSWVTPLIQRGWLDLRFEEDGARFLMPARDDAPQLSEQFEQSYAKVKVSPPSYDWYTHAPIGRCLVLPVIAWGQCRMQLSGQQLQPTPQCWRLAC
jgi:hypothetical protein